MESAEHPNTYTLALDVLVERALKELERLKYSRRSVRRYRSAWHQLIAFARTAALGESQIPPAKPVA